MSKENKDIKETWSKIRCALFFIVLYVSWMIPCFMKYQEDYGTPKTEEMIECTEDIIRWKQESTETHEERTETNVEALDIEIVAKVNNKNDMYFGKIVGLAEKHESISSSITGCYSDTYSEEQMQTQFVKNGNVYDVKVGMVGESDFRPTGCERK